MIFTSTITFPDGNHRYGYGDIDGIIDFIRRYAVTGASPLYVSITPVEDTEDGSGQSDTDADPKVSQNVPEPRSADGWKM